MKTGEQPEPLNLPAQDTSSSQPAAMSLIGGPCSEPERFDHRSSNRISPSVELHIEELVLKGFEPAHRYAIGEVIKRELTRLFTEQGALSAMTENGEIDHLNGGAISVQPDSNASATGIQLARAIYVALKG